MSKRQRSRPAKKGSEASGRAASASEPKGAERGRSESLHDQAGNQAVQAALKNGGRPLDPATRAEMEAAFDADFGAVRLHRDGGARETVAALSARAVTRGEHILLGETVDDGDPAAGRALVAHELAHVTQQRQQKVDPDTVSKTGDAFEQAADSRATAALQGTATPPLPAGAVPAVQRSELEEELDEELKKWAAGKETPPSLDPKDKAYAFTLQEYGFGLTHESAMAPDVKQKPADKKEQAKWTKDMKKAHLLALKILAAGEKVEQKETRAGMLGQDLATAGFITEALDVAGRMKSKKQKGYIYAELVRHLAKASLDQLKQITTFFAVEDKQSLDDHPVLKAIRDKSGKFSKALGKEKMKAVVEIIVANYPPDSDLIELLSEILVFYPEFRTTFSDWLWTVDKTLLFKVVDSDYFVEPGYGGSAFADEKGDAVVLEMKDMTWVYTVKQKYYVNFIVELAAKHKVAVPKPRDLTFNSIRAWLEANTERIGEVLQKEYPKQPEEITAVYEHIADIFFFHVDRGDVTPDLAGHIGGLGPEAPNRMRLKADCDVLATYATRLLVGSGFTAIGYLALVPPDPLPGHAVALLEKGGSYYIVNNKEVSAVAAADKAAALQKLRDDALQIYDPTPADYKVYYADAKAGGAMPKELRDTEPSTRRENLEP